MTAPLLLILILLSIVFFLLKRRKRAMLTGLLAFSFFMFVGCEFAPTLLLNYLQKTSENKNIDWKKENTLIVFGTGISQDTRTQTIRPGNSSFSRLTMATVLYRDCKENNRECHILLSGGDPFHKGQTEAEVYRTQLIALGVNQADILLETNSLNTFQNARFCCPLLQKTDPNQKQVFISSGFTLKRALSYLAYFNIYPQPVAADFITIRISPWPSAYNLVVTDLALHELIGLWRFKLYNLFGWNK